MGFYIKLAWRNLFRNKRRTIIASIAIGIGLAALMFTDAVMVGMKDNMIRSATSSFLGEAQIHAKGFRDTQEVDLTIKGLEGVKHTLDQSDVVTEYACRTTTFSMITSPANVSSIVLFGIEPEKEKILSEIDDAIGMGEFFGGDNERDIVIGKKLAATLEVGLGDRVVVTVSQSKTGEIFQEMFRVSGIYFFNIKEMDTGMAFVRLKKAQEMLALGAEVHEIAVKFKDLRLASNDKLAFWSDFGDQQNEVASWVVLLPQLKAVFDMTGISLLLMGIILFAVVTFGIINTLFMSLYERMFEFGVIRAVGTRPSGVRKLVIYEAGALAFISNVMGVLLGLGITSLFMKVGIDYTGIEFAGTTITKMLYPVMKVHQFIVYPVSVFLFTLIVGLYPAMVAGKMKVAEALRKSL